MKATTYFRALGQSHAARGLRITANTWASWPVWASDAYAEGCRATKKGW